RMVPERIKSRVPHVVRGAMAGQVDSDQPEALAERPVQLLRKGARGRGIAVDQHRRGPLSGRLVRRDPAVRRFDHVGLHRLSLVLGLRQRSRAAAKRHEAAIRMILSWFGYTRDARRVRRRSVIDCFHAILPAALNPDSSRVVTTSSDKTARIWDVHFATMPAKGSSTKSATSPRRP